MHQFEPCNLIPRGREERFDLPDLSPGYVDVQSDAPRLLRVDRGPENTLSKVVSNLFDG